MDANGGSRDHAGLEVGGWDDDAAAGFVNDVRTVVVGHGAGGFGDDEACGRIVGGDGATAGDGGGFDDGLRRERQGAEHADCCC